MNVWPACMHVYQVCAVPTETRKKVSDPLELQLYSLNHWATTPASIIFKSCVCMSACLYVHSMCTVPL